MPVHTVLAGQAFILMCPRGDLNTQSRAFSPILRLNTQMGEKSRVRGFHALMLAGTPEPVSSGLADFGLRAAGVGAIPGVTAAPSQSAGALPVGYSSRCAIQWAPGSADLCTWPTAGGGAD
jgi:hypothetical protein